MTGEFKQRHCKYVGGMGMELNTEYTVIDLIYCWNVIDPTSFGCEVGSVMCRSEAFDLKWIITDERH